MSRSASHRRILFATSAVGAASVISILLGLVRMKAAALILGTTGIGFVGLLQSLIGTGAAIGGMGVNQSATRQIAASRADKSDYSARKALFIATLVLAVLSAATIWAFRHPLAHVLLGDEAPSSVIGWMGIGVGLTIVAGSQGALLAGLGRVADVARLSLLTAILSTIAAITFLLLMGRQAIMPYLLSTPAAGVLAGWLYAARADAPSGTGRRCELNEQWRQLLGLGAAVMASGVIVNVSQLTVRGLLSQHVGLAELGLYQAASSIAVTYLAFILQAMSADFYPRLSALPAGTVEASKLINEQTEVALLLGAPVILVMIGLAEPVLALLYAREFAGGATLLRWMVLADILRIASWPLGFALLVAGRGRAFVILELAAFGTFVGITYVLLPMLGVQAAGIGFISMYIVYLPLMLLVVRTNSDIRWSATVKRDLAFLFVCGAALVSIAEWSELGSATIGIVLGLAWFIVAFRRLRHLIPTRWRGLS